MATKLDIFNQALRYVGQETTNDVDDDNARAKQCRTFYDITRDEILSRYAWVSATFRTALTADATSPAFEYSYRYLLPSGASPDTPWCLRVLKTNQDGYPWKVEGRYILTDLSSMSIVYIGRPENLGILDPFCIDAIALSLAIKIAVNSRGKDGMKLAEMLERRLHSDVMPTARANNAFQKPEHDQRHTVPGPYNAARFRGRGFERFSPIEII